MMASKVALVVALSLLSTVAVHGCGQYCQPPVAVPTPPVAVPSPPYLQPPFMVPTPPVGVPPLPYFQPPVVVPTPPVTVPPPAYHGEGGHGHGGQCSIDVLRPRVCANVLDGLLGLLKVGIPAYDECCPLLQGLVDLNAAVCLCNAIEANILGIVQLSVPVDITLLLNHCGKRCPSDFTCSAH